MQIVELFLDYTNTIFFGNVEDGVKKGDFVVAQTHRGVELMRVGRKVDVAEPNCEFIRRATQKDIEDHKSNQALAKEVLPEVQNIMYEYGFDVKVALIEYMLDANKMVIHFASETRIDFRELVKMLAKKYRCKIEMHQIGMRDEVGIKGGIGVCGKECCCKAFLTDFAKVSIKMAKTQNVSLSPNRVSGLCGKLLCCLSYENEMYNEITERMPAIHTKVTTKDGEGEVIYNDILRERVHVRFGDEGYNIKDYSLSEIEYDKTK